MKALTPHSEAASGVDQGLVGSTIRVRSHMEKRRGRAGPVRDEPAGERRADPALQANVLGEDEPAIPPGPQAVPERAQPHGLAHRHATRRFPRFTSPSLGTARSSEPEPSPVEQDLHLGQPVEPGPSSNANWTSTSVSGPSERSSVLQPPEL